MVVERRNNHRQPVDGNRDIIVREGDDRACGGYQPGISGMAETHSFASDVPQTRVASKVLHCSLGVIDVTLVDDDELEIRMIVGKDRGDGRNDTRSSPPRAYDRTDSRPKTMFVEDRHLM
jgi:hypothetical protein